MKAAFWEYEENHNIRSARGMKRFNKEKKRKFMFFVFLWKALMQRALRILKDDKEIWVQYVRLELLYRKKLSDRFKLMGVNEEAFVR